MIGAAPERVVDLAHMPQGGGDQGAHELPVARRQLVEFGMFPQGLVERFAAP